MIIARQNVVIKREAGRDKYGESLGFVDYPVKARVVNEIKKTRNSAGDEVVTALTVEVRLSELAKSGAEKIVYSDEIHFIDEFGNETSRPPQNIAPAQGFSAATSFVRVLL